MKEKVKEKKVSPTSDPNSRPKRTELSAKITNGENHELSAHIEKEQQKVGNGGTAHGQAKKKFKV